MCSRSSRARRAPPQRPPRRPQRRRSLRALGVKAREWQDEVQQMAKAADLDVLRFGLDEVESAIALSEFVAERRLRKR